MPTIREVINDLMLASTELPKGLESDVLGFHDAGRIDVSWVVNDGVAYIEEVKE